MAGGAVLCVVGEGPALWALDPATRNRRLFRRAGVETVIGEGAALPGGSDSVILVRAGYALDPGLAAPLAATPGVALVAGEVVAAVHVAAGGYEAARALLEGDGPLPDSVGLRAVTAAELSSSYNEALRKREAPYLLAVSQESRRAVEWRMFQGSYKGVTDFVTKWLWPVPAFWVTKGAARLGLSPNFVTLVSLVLVVWAYFDFAAGDYGRGLAVAWLMTFLDTVDGKLARVTVTSSAMGNVFDHGIDLIHPPFWYWAWGAGLAAAGAGGGFAGAHLDLLMAVIIGGYVLGRVLEGLFMWAFGMEIHVWRPVDSRFRLITARRNPNLALLMAGALAGRPDLGLVAVAGWTVASLAFHILRLVLAALARRRYGALNSWLAEAGS